MFNYISNRELLKKNITADQGRIRVKKFKHTDILSAENKEKHAYYPELERWSLYKGI